MNNSDIFEQKAIKSCAGFMAAAARTAPKTCGIDNVVVRVVEDQEVIKDLIRAMREIYKRINRRTFERDSGNIENLETIFLIGVKNNPSGLNCGFCGSPTCEAQKSKGGVCAFNSIDLGIAIGSAVSIASRFHIDNRVMYSIGRAAMEMKLFGEDVVHAIGVPLSVTGKNPFFDRK